MTKPTSEFFVPGDFDATEAQSEGIRLHGYGTLSGEAFAFKEGARWYHERLAKHLEGLPVLEVYEWQYGEKTYWRTPDMGGPEGTHTCKAWGIAPIVPERAAETADDLLRELVASSVSTAGVTIYKPDLIERAKALLSKAGEGK